MSEATIAKVYRFEASHHLPNHDGKCRNPHGHSYRVTVQIAGPIITDGPQEGMVMDFSRLNDAWAALEPLLDHRDLNESIGEQCGPTTAENIALFILNALRPMLSEPTRLTGVTVWETATSSASVRV